MSYEGDIRLGDTIDLKFTTRSFTTGAPTTLAGTPVISAYPGNSTTQLTAGITLTVDFDAVTGLHNVRVAATSGNGYATATNYSLVITTGTVGGVSVVGEVVGSFSIENRSALMPTIATRTLDVTAANKVNGVVLVDTLTTYTGNTVQTGDSFGRLGAPAGASVSADIATINAAGLVALNGYIGEFRVGSTFSFKFKSAGALVGGTISAYESNNLTEITAGITLDTGFDGLSGLNHVQIAATGGNGYIASNYTLVITAGTIGGVSAIGRIVGSFSLETRLAGAGELVVPAGYIGDFLLGAQFSFKFLTKDPTSGAPTALLGSPVVAIYASGDTNELTAGITLTGGYDGRSGFHDVTIVPSSANGYTAPANYTVMLTAGTVSGVSVVPQVIASFSLGARSAATPAQVNAEVVDALNIDTYAEPAQGAPAATATLVTKLGFLFKAWRNRQTQTATTYSLYNDDALTVDHKSTVSDDGSVFNRNEIGTGP